MGGLDNENREFYSSIRSQGERFEEITLLDDIKRIKSELVREVDKMRAMVRDKENLDQKAFDSLSSQVDILKRELDKARHSANTDGLTGVNNRKALDHHLRSLVERARTDYLPEHQRTQRWQGQREGVLPTHPWPRLTGHLKRIAHVTATIEP